MRRKFMYGLTVHLTTLLIWIISGSLLSSSAIAQEVPFSRGVNLTQWFQVSTPGEIQFSRYTIEDFRNIKGLGCDVIRLPINLHAMTDGAPNYELDPLFTRFMDEVIDWAEELELYLILDNHTFDPLENTSPSVEPILTMVWTQMAERYGDRSNFLLYEVLNEPHGIRDDIWNEIQANVIQAIRTIDTIHTIIVGGSGYNSYHNLQLIPDLGDDNLIYTFHFYDPFLFTHQGATWVEPSMAPVREIPFPYDQILMPSLPGELAGTWVHTLYTNYGTAGTVDRVKQLIDIAVSFREERNLPVFCGEFGVHIPNSPAEDRVYWYEVVRQYLEEKEIPWTSWDYHGGFGLFEEGSNGLFQHDINVPLIEALGLNVPPQTDFQMKPDSVGFLIYSDYIGRNIRSEGYGGEQNFYSTDNPNYGDNHIAWSNVGQYNAIGFDFAPDRDLGNLAREGYALDLFVRSSEDNLAFDVRFVDTKSAEEDRPWRMHFVINEDLVQWDGTWQHLHIPLQTFNEHGAWDNAWYEPQGLFDWSAVDRFEISTEYGGIMGELNFDHIVITNQDTARVQQTTGLDNPNHGGKIEIYPNPVDQFLILESTYRFPLGVRITDLTGRVIYSREMTSNNRIDLTDLSSGTYIFTARTSEHFESHKIIKL